MPKDEIIISIHIKEPKTVKYYKDVDPELILQDFMVSNPDPVEAGITKITVQQPRGSIQVKTTVYDDN